MIDIEVKQIMEKLDVIKGELDYIKNNMVNVDAILTEEDKKIITKGRKEFKEGKTVSLEGIKKRLRI